MPSRIFKLFIFVWVGIAFVVYFLPSKLLAEAQKLPVIISEICFLPKKGKPEWIELKNVSKEPVNIAGWQISNGKVNLVLPEGLTEMPPQAHILIILDGKGDKKFSSQINDLSFDGDNLVVLHSPQGLSGDILGDASKGECALYAKGRQDENSIRAFVVWGHSGSNSKLVDDAVKAGLWQSKRDFLIVEHWSGGVKGPITQIQPGGSIGLYNGCYGRCYYGLCGSRSDDWVVYRPDEVSPGRENPLPAPYLHLPWDGSEIAGIEDPQVISFSWVKICGVFDYEFQLCKDPDCREVIDDTQVHIKSYEWPSYRRKLPPMNAVYYWRVRAIDKSGRKSRWSEVYKLTLGYPKDE